MATKSGIGTIIIELLFGAALIIIGVVRPAFIWKWSFVAENTARFGNTLVSIVLVVLGVGVILWTLVKPLFAKKA